MTNEEKARSIAECVDGHINIISFESAKIMAAWKDKQFKEYLEKKKDSLDMDYYKDSYEYNECKYSLLREIINELFGE